MPAEWASELVAEKAQHRPYNGPRATTVRFRRRSWAPDPEDGSQSAPVWRYNIAWVSMLVWAVASPEGRARLSWTQPGGRPESISPKTFIAAAKEAAAYADHGTGRNVTVGRARLGLAVARSPRTMTRFWRAMTELGFARTRQNGRYLTASERAAAYRRHGNRQLRMAAQRDLVSPRVRGFVHLPSGGGLKADRAVSRMVKHQRASSQSGAVASLPPGHDSGWQISRGVSTPGRTIWGRAMFEFARDVRDLLPWLREVHPSSIARVLHRAAVSPERWTAADLVRRLETEFQFRARAARFGQRAAAPAAFRFMNTSEIGDPLAYTRWLLTQYIDPAEPTLTEDRAEYLADRAELVDVDEREGVRRSRAVQLQFEQFEREAERAAAERAAEFSPTEFSRLRAESDRQIAAMTSRGLTTDEDAGAAARH